ncbi:hypothetical protein T07_3137 [Trichinella nelsoni]|uniref:Uncharacterized protein n=1 Tax=Trichinella nelsoni TaxID=6336 RepID=A0A0V0SH64_9BILA|nr:hypothetical protein T07_3137 [Trichinella nelsoni]
MSDEGTSHSEAYSCATVLFNWMQQQKEFSATQLIVMLNNMIDRVTSKGPITSHNKPNVYCSASN